MRAVRTRIETEFRFLELSEATSNGSPFTEPLSCFIEVVVDFRQHDCFWRELLEVIREFIRLVPDTRQSPRQSRRLAVSN